MEKFVTNPRRPRKDKGHYRKGHTIRVFKKVWSLLKTVI